MLLSTKLFDRRILIMIIFFGRQKSHFYELQKNNLARCSRTITRVTLQMKCWISIFMCGCARERAFVELQSYEDIKKMANESKCTYISLALTLSFAIVWISPAMKMNEWPNQRMSERTNERTNEKKCTHKLVTLNYFELSGINFYL